MSTAPQAQDMPSEIKFSCPPEPSPYASLEKLDWKQIGLYEIAKVVSPYANELALRMSMKVHPVFHVSLLSLATSDPVPSQVQLPLPPIEIEGEEEWEVDIVLYSRRRNGQLWYLTRYVGYVEPSWQPAEDLQHTPNKIREFYTRYPRKP